MKIVKKTLELDPNRRLYKLDSQIKKYRFNAKSRDPEIDVVTPCVPIAKITN